MMQVSSMVRIPGRDEALAAQFRHQQQLYGQPRTQAAMMANQYVTPTTQAYGYGYQQRVSAPQSPPSPPGDELNKPSLPSISSLLGMSEDATGTAQQTMAEQQVNTVMTQSPQYQGDVISQSTGPMVSDQAKMTLPPTPPLGPEAMIDGHQSPSAISTQPAVSAPAYYMQNPIAQLDVSQHRHSYSSAVSRSTAMAVQPVSSAPYSATPYSASPYHPSPVTLGSNTPYYASDTPVLPSSGMYAQRPLPSNFPPPLHMPLGMGTAPPGPSPWQHHHYINHTSQSSFPQSQDRYICPTCNKAFSRPSSLRIHSHSHTGEKPFKCSHAGCGKAFSVRSNMKRHERGCHASVAPGMMSS